jgi:hypothetical protein
MYVPRLVLVGLLIGCTGEENKDPAEDTSVVNDDAILDDEDGDGYKPSEGDCDDSDVNVNPAAVEICDGIDNNCNGEVDEGVATQFYVDADNDGFGDDATAQGYCEPPVGFTTVGGDCDDADATFYPDAPEPCTEDVDYNCDGVVAYADDDGDGWAACEDCDDLDPDVSPAATEICNGIDDDCDGEADPVSSFDVLPFYADTDADGYGDADSVTNACAAPPGYVDDTSDCDDSRADVNPGATEVCDDTDTDEDCSGAADDADSGVDVTTFSAWYADLDGDGYGPDDSETLQCDAPAGYLAVGGDCNDASADFYPGAPETDCSDPNDYNCDGSVAYVDADGDLWAACVECDDSDPAVNPAATELCNGIDDDCDGVVDPDTAADSLTWYADADADSYGDPVVYTESCAAPAGYVADSSDCDDTLASVNPAGTELCNGTDDDCDGVIDPDSSADALTWYADADGDGYGDASSTTVACEVPAGFGTDDTDCDDSDASVNPAGTELCNGIDDDCDGVIDPDTAYDALTWYADADADLYGNAASTTLDCSQPAGYVADDTDCDDARSDINPGADEICDALDEDEDCDGLADDADPSTTAASQSTWYTDADGDGYGDVSVAATGCEQPASYVVDNTDCDDTRSGVHPGASEYCDALDDDEDCDGLADDDDPSVDSSTFDTWYIDGDGDGYGGTTTTDACDVPSGYIAADGDCDDADPTINPAATEVCDGLDNDCDGSVDDGAGGCCGSPGFDGTYGTTWTHLATAPNYLFSLATFKSDDDDYVWNAYGSNLSYYDPTTDVWASVASSTPCTGTWNSMAPYDGDLWMIRCGKVYQYDVAADTWATKGTYVGADDYNQTVASCDGHIYGHSGNGSIVDYDVAAGTVTQHSDGHGSLYETRLAYDPTEDAVYFGGFSAGALYRFDVAAGTFSTMTPHPEGFLNDIFCGDWSGHLYAAGGSSGRSLWQYDMAANSWATITSFPIDHGNNGSCTVGTDGYLYMADYVKTSFYKLEVY